MSFALLLAQAVAAAQPEAAAAPQQGVISYPPSFFADQRPNSALDMLSRIPGFSFDSGSGVRGFEGAAGNVLIDGQRPASKSDSLDNILNRIPASKVERIDIIRGGAPGIDMQGKTVLANVIRKPGGGLRGLAQVRNFHTDDGRNLPAVRVEASGELGRTKWEVSARQDSGLDDGVGKGRGTHIFADGRPTELSRLDGEGDGRPYSLAGSVETAIAGGSLRLNGRLLSDKFKGEDHTEFLTVPPRSESSVFIQHVDETEVGARYSRAFGPDTDIELVGLRTDRKRDFLNVFTDTATSEFSQDRDSSETIGRGVFKHRFSQSLSFEAGGETAINKLDSVSSVTGVVVPGASVQVEEDRSELFTKGTWRPAPAWTLDAGLRYEFSTITSHGDVVLEKSLKFLKPRLTVTWSPKPDTQLRMRLEREVGQLNFGDFVASGNLNSAGGISAGNPDLDPEQAWVIEAALEKRFWTKASAVLTYRHFEITDVIDRGPVTASDGSVFDTPTNIGDATKDTLKLELTLPFDKLGFVGAQLKGDVTKQWTKVTDPTTGDSREISGNSPIFWQANFSYDLPQWKLTWGANVGGGFRESYYRFNLIEDFKLRTNIRAYVEWKPSPQWSFRGEVANVTKRDLRDTFNLYPGPRNEGGLPDVDDRHNTGTPRGFVLQIRRNFGA
jgi:outer membrane receptor protein involved in Fe transport